MAVPANPPPAPCPTAQRAVEDIPDPVGVLRSIRSHPHLIVVLTPPSEQLP